MDINDFLTFWRERGVKLPDPEHYPKCFSWYVSLYKLYNADEENKKELANQ